MKLRQIGELKLLQEVRKKFSSTDSSIIVGIGDDAAVIAPQKEKILVTTDMMNEGIHFDLSFTSPFHLGFKLVSVNVSDIFAMGGRPKHLFLNIAMKKDEDENTFWKMYEGIFSAMNIYGVSLVGGDLCAAENDMVLSATIIGAGDKIITRGGASVGDKIYVTGTTGDSACGLEMLQRLTDESRMRVRSLEFGVSSKTSQPLNLSTSQVVDWDIAEPLLRRHLMPVARDSAEIANYATSMIDISDGLFIDLCRICDESNVGARVYLNKIPMSDEMKKTAEIMKLDPIHLATSGGEDYELLFTAPPEIKFEIRNSKFEILKTTCIGEIIEKDRIVVDKSGKESALKTEGYQHFGTSG
ncbi:MAG: thiamine-phosphate kinase [Nitrospirota bacterium]